MALNSVVLPAPLGPMMARRCPRGTVSLTPSTARRASNATTTSVSVRIGSDTIVPGRALPAKGSRLAPCGIVSSSFLDALEHPRVRRLFQVGLRIVFPELRHVGIGRGRHVPELSV